MPKLKKVGRKPARLEPYSKKRIKRPSTITKDNIPRQASSPFLGLPSEIRMNIYSYFLRTKTHPTPCFDLPLAKDVLQAVRSDETSKAGYAAWMRSKCHDKEISITRKSLNSICHKITAEWTLLFYGTTTAIVHRSKTRWVGYHPVRFCNPPSFAHDFLRVLHPAKLANIRRIAYDVPKDDLHFVAGFPKHLMKYMSGLPSLEQVSLRCDPQQRNHRLWPVPIGNPQMKSLLLPYFWRYLRASLGRHRTLWEDVEKLFLGLSEQNQTLHAKRQGAGILKGWKVERKLVYQTAGHSFMVTGLSSLVCWVNDMEIVFKKAKVATTEDQPPLLKLLVETASQQTPPDWFVAHEGKVIF